MHGNQPSPTTHRETDSDVPSKNTSEVSEKRTRRVTAAIGEDERFCVQVYVEPLPPLQSAPVPVVVRMRPPEATMYEGKDSKVSVVIENIVRKKEEAGGAERQRREREDGKTEKNGANY